MSRTSAQTDLLPLVAISDDEASDLGDFDTLVTTKRASASTKAVALKDEDDDVDNEMLDVVGDDNAGDAQDEGGEDGEELEEDEYVTACSPMLAAVPARD